MRKSCVHGYQICVGDLLRSLQHIGNACSSVLHEVVQLTAQEVMRHKVDVAIPMESCIDELEKCDLLRCHWFALADRGLMKQSQVKKNHLIHAQGFPQRVR